MIQQLLNGSQKAREAFAERMKCVLRLLSARNARSGHPLRPDELLDLAQDVQLAVWGKLSSYRGEARLETWVYSFCHLKMMRHLEQARSRSERERAWREEVERSLADAARESGMGGNSKDDPGLLSLLSRLGSREAQTIRLHHMEGLTFVEIAEELGISASSVKTYYYRGLENLESLAQIRREASLR